MLPSTIDRVAINTSQERRQLLDRQLKARITAYQGADRQRIDQRLAELDNEWDIERLIEVEAPLMIGLGATLGLLYNPKWLGLSAAAAAMVILHNLQGWYPLLPLFHRLGIRSQTDIEQERSALRVLRQDPQIYSRH